MYKTNQQGQLIDANGNPVMQVQANNIMNNAFNSIGVSPQQASKPAANALYQQQYQVQQQMQWQQGNGYSQPQQQGWQRGSNQQQGQQWNNGGYQQPQQQGWQQGSNQQQGNGYQQPQSHVKQSYYIQTSITEQDVNSAGGQWSCDVLNVDNVHYILFLNLDTICKVIAAYLQRNDRDNAYKCIGELVRIIQEVNKAATAKDKSLFKQLEGDVKPTIYFKEFKGKMLTVGSYTFSVYEAERGIETVSHNIFIKNELLKPQDQQSNNNGNGSNQQQGQQTGHGDQQQDGEFYILDPVDLLHEENFEIHQTLNKDYILTRTGYPFLKTAPVEDIKRIINRKDALKKLDKSEAILLKKKKQVYRLCELSKAAGALANMDFDEFVKFFRIIKEKCKVEVGGKLSNQLFNDAVEEFRKYAGDCSEFRNFIEKSRQFYTMESQSPQQQGQQLGSNQQQAQGQQSNNGGYQQTQSHVKQSYCIESSITRQEVDSAGGKWSCDVLNVDNRYNIYYIKFLNLDTICKVIETHLQRNDWNNAYRCIGELVRIIQEAYRVVCEGDTTKFSPENTAIQETVNSNNFGNKLLNIGSFKNTVFNVRNCNVETAVQYIFAQNGLQQPQIQQQNQQWGGNQQQGNGYGYTQQGQQWNNGGYQQQQQPTVQPQAQYGQQNFGQQQNNYNQQYQQTAQTQAYQNQQNFGQQQNIYNQQQPNQAQAPQGQQNSNQNVHYKLDEKTKTLTFFKGYGSVIKKEDFVHNNTKYIENVICSNDITEIGANAFWNCCKLVQIEAPSVKIIGDNAFSHDYLLEKADFPNVKNIKSSSFAGCTKLTKVCFPTLETIEFGSFLAAGLLEISETDMPNVTKIGDEAFLQCRELAKVRFPMLETINSTSFAESGLSEINEAYFPNVTKIKDRAFEKCKNLTKVCFSKLEFVESQAFVNCKKLTYVNIPNIKEIDKEAFVGCDALSKIHTGTLRQCELIYNKLIQEETMSKNLKYGSLGLFYSPGVRYDNDNLDQDKHYDIYLDGTLKFFEGYGSIIKNGAFQCRQYIEKVICSNDITEIGANAFDTCHKLVQIEAPSVEIIGDRAFSFDGLLEKADFPNAKEIGEMAFWNCVNLTKVCFPMLKTIKGGSFSTSGLSEIDETAFPNVTKIESDGGAFDNCEKLTKVCFPKLKFVESQAFVNCKKLTYVNIPNIEEIDQDAFVGCEALSEIHTGTLQQCKLIYNKLIKEETMSKKLKDGSLGLFYSGIRYNNNEANVGTPTQPQGQQGQQSFGQQQPDNIQPPPQKQQKLDQG